MKKTLLATLSVAALLTTASSVNAESNFKSGFKIGGGAGYKHHRVKNITTVDSTNPFAVNETMQKSATNDTVALQFHVGYDFIINRFLAAIEFDYRYSPGKVKMKFNSSQPLLEPTQAAFEVQQKHPHDCGLSGRLGGLITENFALYAIANVRLGKFEHKFLNTKKDVDDLSRSSSKTKYLWGVGGGVGARCALPKGFTVGFETTYDVYQRLELNKEDIIFPGNVHVADVNTQSKRPHIFLAMFKLSKTF